MKHLYNKNWHKILFIFALTCLDQSAYLNTAAPAAYAGRQEIGAAAAAAADGASETASAQKYPPRNWYLKFLCWNTSWSSIEWKRAAIWFLYEDYKKENLNQHLPNHYFATEQKGIDWLKDIFKKLDNRRPDANLGDIPAQTIYAFKTEALTPYLCDNIISSIKCDDDLEFKITYNDETYKNKNQNDWLFTPNKDKAPVQTEIEKKLSQHFINEVKALAKYIIFADYDVICLQECPSQFSKFLMSQLENPEYTLCANDKDVNTGCCIIYKKQLELSSIKCTKEESEKIDGLSFKSQEISAIKFPNSNDGCSIYSIHSNLIFKTNEHKDILKKKITTFFEKNNIILLGDFNITQPTIANTLLGEDLTSKLTITTQSPLDHCIFKNQFFTEITNTLLNNKNTSEEFIEKINLAHHPFEVSILKNDLFNRNDFNSFKDLFENKTVDKIVVRQGSKDQTVEQQSLNDHIEEQINTIKEQQKKFNSIKNFIFNKAKYPSLAGPREASTTSEDTSAMSRQASITSEDTSAMSRQASTTSEDTSAMSRQASKMPKKLYYPTLCHDIQNKIINPLKNLGNLQKIKNDLETLIKLLLDNAKKLIYISEDKENKYKNLSVPSRETTQIPKVDKKIPAESHTLSVSINLIQDKESLEDYIDLFINNISYGIQIINDIDTKISKLKESLLDIFGPEIFQDKAKDDKPKLSFECTKEIVEKFNANILDIALIADPENQDLQELKEKEEEEEKLQEQKKAVTDSSASDSDSNDSAENPPTPKSRKAKESPKGRGSPKAKRSKR